MEVEFVDGSSFGEFVAQFVSPLQDVVCVEDDRVLRVFSDSHPSHLEFVREENSIYYLKNRKHTFAVFCKEHVKKLMPQWDFFSDESTSEQLSDSPPISFTA